MIWKRLSNFTARFSVWSVSAAGQLADVLLQARNHNILLCQRNDPVQRTVEQDGRLHHAFDVSPEMFDKACKLFHKLGIKIHEPVDYRPGGFFHRTATLRSRPSGNRIELRDASWKKGMPTPTYEQIVNP